MIMNDSVQRGAVYVRDLNIAPGAFRTDDIDLRGLTALLHEQLSYFNISLSGMVAQSDAQPPGRRFDPHVQQTFLGGDWS